VALPAPAQCIAETSHGRTAPAAMSSGPSMAAALPT
jgi:hypothetical protein